MKEIGSEFWTTENSTDFNSLEYLNIGRNYKLLMSGRTAIDYVLSNIKDDRKIVYMPDYCCESMIKPFKDNGYKVYYYFSDVINNKYDIDVNFDCSIFFAMSYFGYNISNMDKYIELFNNRKIIIIEDITHRFLSDVNHCNKSTYLIASLRKWFPIISGGVAISMNSKFEKDINDYTINKKFVLIKSNAMYLKKEYMLGNNTKKEVFLILFNNSNHMFEEYKKMKIDDESKNILKHLDIKRIREARINNCKTIEKKLKNNKNIKILYRYNTGDCPLFVPIVLKNRDSVRKKLIDNRIYLPVHWPNSNHNNKIYDSELSLICDQRYSEKEIEDYIDKLIEIVGD